MHSHGISVSHSKMFSCYTAFKHLAVNFLYESQIGGDNLVSEKDTAEVEEIQLSKEKEAPRFLPA